MRIIEYEDAYKEKMIAMVKSARAALGINGEVRSDLYDVKANYMDCGDAFFIAVNEEDEVFGCLGFSRLENSDEAFLHRFYVHPDYKRRGIGSLLLAAAEEAMLARGIHASRVHLGGEKDIWFESRAFYPKHGYTEYAPRYMKKNLLKTVE